MSIIVNSSSLPFTGSYIENRYEQILGKGCDKIETLPFNKSEELQQQLLSSRTLITYEELYFLILNSPIVGEGCFSQVFKSKFENNEVAVKILKFIPERYKAFDREVQALLYLKDFDIPQVIQLKGVCSFPLLGIITEYIGPNLYSLIHQETKSFYFSLKKKIQIAIDLAEGMIQLHKLNILHRDLTTLNILLSTGTESKLKICDFGICCSYEGKSLTEYLGPPKYLAPEISRREPYGNAIDVWYYGTVLYELFYETKFDLSSFRNTDSRKKNCIEIIRDLIDQCLQDSQYQRPIFETILSTLVSIQKN